MHFSLLNITALISAETENHAEKLLSNNYWKFGDWLYIWFTLIQRPKYSNARATNKNI